MEKLRTRFAPSPTGYLHLGSLRTALYTYLLARHSKGTYVLRVEDTDQKREVEGATEAIMETLRGTGLTWDEGPDVGGPYGPYLQSERKALYLPYAHELIARGKAYYCFCPQERLDALREEYAAKGETFKYDKHCLHIPPEEAQRRVDAGEPHVIRLNMPEDGATGFDDVLFGHIEVDASTLDDIVLIKSDGMPTYNFANVIDDHTMHITHVMRGSEYLSSTPKYNYIYDSFGWEKPLYIHLSQVMATPQRKLSKRHGDPTYDDLLQEGFLKDAVLNYMALVGWSPGDDREFFTLDELVEAFELKGLSKSPALFDKVKLRHFNAEYIRRMTPEEFERIMIPWIREDIDITRFNTCRIAELMQPRCEVLCELKGRLNFLMEMPEYDLAIYRNKRMKTDEETCLATLLELRPLLEGIHPWQEAVLHDEVMEYIEGKGVKNGFVLWPLRIAISGLENTPAGAFEIAGLLGRAETLKRIDASIAMLQASR